MIRYLLLLACFASLRAETAVQHLLESKMYARLKAYDDALPSALGVAAIDLTSGRIFVYNGEAVFPAASTIKIPILVEMYRAMRRGEFKPDDPVTVQPSEAAGGSGDLQNALKSGPVRLTVRELMRAMIENSDNTAANRCIAMAKMDRVNRLLSDLGFRTIRLRRVMMDSAAAQRNDENTASPLEMARLVEMLDRGKLGDAESTNEMLGLMRLVKGGMRTALPPDVRTASKTGALPGVDCEAGIVYLERRPFVLSVYSTFLEGETKTVAAVTRIVFEYFSALARSNEFGNRVR
jgi:beta-lactamase class A